MIRYDTIHGIQPTIRYDSIRYHLIHIIFWKILKGQCDLTWIVADWTGGPSFEPEGQHRQTNGDKQTCHKRVFSVRRLMFMLWKKKIDTRSWKIDTLSGNKMSIYIAVSIKSLSPNENCHRLLFWQLNKPDRRTSEWYKTYRMSLEVILKQERVKKLFPVPLIDRSLRTEVFGQVSLKSPLWISQCIVPVSPLPTASWSVPWPLWWRQSPPGLVYRR